MQAVIAVTGKDYVGIIADVSQECKKFKVNISDVSQRESFRQISYAGMACEKTIMGQGLDGYRQAIAYLAEKYNK